MELQQWPFRSGSCGRTSSSAGVARGARQRRPAETFERTGASVMGKRMFDAGEHAWPEDAPFRTPVFVVTHERREPWERPGGATGTSASRVAAPRSWRT